MNSIQISIFMHNCVQFLFPIWWLSPRGFEPKLILEFNIYESQISRRNLGDFYFYSLSMNSLTPGGSGARPFLFLMSAMAVACIDFGTSDHSLKEVFQVARPAV